MIRLEDATSLILQHARPLGVERLLLEQAIGRILAEDVEAPRDGPATAVSAMDGYAVCDGDFDGGSRTLDVVGEARAGRAYEAPLTSGTCVRIFTGAPLPRNADRVIMQENAQVVGAAATFGDCVTGPNHVRARGSDFRAGDRLLKAGQRLSSLAVVAAGAADLAAVRVWRRPRIAILSTGDELVEPGQAGLAPDRIPDSVSLGIQALVQAWGGEVVRRVRLGDDISTLRAAAESALDAADLVVVTGGASVGEYDLAKAMFSPLELVFSKVAMKPGKPVWFGRSRSRPVIGLPGNPTAAMITGRLLLAPLVAGLSGARPNAALAWREGRLGTPLTGGGSRDHFLCGRGDRTVEALRSQDSSGQKTLGQAELLIRLSAGASPRAPGDGVQVLDF